MIFSYRPSCSLCRCTLKIGIEPQVQRIGKYKSFGDTFNRNNISEAQREVISSLLMEASDFWADTVALSLNKTAAEVMQVWSDEGVILFF